MTTARLSRYEVVVADQSVDAMIVERPGLPPLLALRESSSYGAVVNAVCQIAPFADEDEVRTLVREHMPAAPDIDGTLANTAAEAAPLGPPRLHTAAIVATALIVTLLCCTALVLARIDSYTHALNDLRAATQASSAAAHPEEPAATRERGLTARERAQLVREVRREVRAEHRAARAYHAHPRARR